MRIIKDLQFSMDVLLKEASQSEDLIQQIEFNTKSVIECLQTTNQNMVDTITDLDMVLSRLNLLK